METLHTAPQEQAILTFAQILPVFGSAIPIVRSGAAQIIAQLACIELPLGMWVDIIELLLNNVKTGDQHTKVATLECLGILCQQIVRAVADPRACSRN